MKRPPLDQSTAAPATAKTARRMSLPPATPPPDWSVIGTAPLCRTAAQVIRSASGHAAEDDEPAVRRDEQQRRIVHPILRHATDPLAGQAVALGASMSLHVAGIPDEKPRTGKAEDEVPIGERLQLEDVVLDGTERGGVEVGEVLAVVGGDPVGRAAPALHL